MANTNFFKSFASKAKDFKEPIVGGLGGAAILGSVGALQGQSKSIVNMHMNDPYYKKTKDKNKRRKLIKKHLLIAGLVGGGLGGAAIGHDIRSVRKSREAWDDIFKEHHRQRARWKEDFNRYRGQYRRAAGTGAATDNAKKFFNVSGATTKAEVSKAYKEMAKKHHPDRGGSEAKMKEINDLYDNLKASSWFNKLAFINGFEKAAESDAKKRKNGDLLKKVLSGAALGAGVATAASLLSKKPPLYKHNLNPKSDFTKALLRKARAKAFEKKAFMAIDPVTAGAGGGLISGYHSGRSAAGTMSNMLSAKGSKTKNEELARTLAKGTAPAGALLALAAGFKNKHKLLGLARKHISPDPQMLGLYEAVLPFATATAGGIAAGGGTGALASLRGRFSKKKD